MRFVFCGTPSFALPTLLAVLRAGHEALLVVTQPDRRSGRGMQLVIPPVKETALAAGLPVVQPEKIRNNLEFRTQLETLKPDVILIVAYGRIIPRWMLDLPRMGNINLHGSLLPKYRGAAPIQWAVANGEPVTGVTTMRIDEGLDTGDILMQREMAVAPDHTSEDLFPLLAAMGAPLMVETLEGLTSGTIMPRKQDDSQATHAPILTREDGRIDFSQPAMTVYNRWRGFQPWPGAWTTLAGKKLIAHRLMPFEPGALTNSAATPAEIHIEQGRLFVACGDRSWLEIAELQPEGKRCMTAAEFLRGHPLQSGDRLG
jgi:methionyl-tRNA formyltransferase